MKRCYLALVAIAAALAITQTATADTWNYTFTDGSITATGTPNWHGDWQHWRLEHH